jgi:hypothetical protein
VYACIKWLETSIGPDITHTTKAKTELPSEFNRSPNSGVDKSKTPKELSDAETGASKKAKVVELGFPDSLTTQTTEPVNT